VAFSGAGKSPRTGLFAGLAGQRDAAKGPQRIEHRRNGF